MDTMPNYNAVQLLHQYSEVLTQTDWPISWRNELSLRRQMRQASDWDNLQLSRQAEIEFVRRSYYYDGQTDKFWTIIFSNLHSGIVQNWLVDTADYLFRSFWIWLASFLTNQTYQPSQLLFLINIYRKEYKEDYMSLVQLFAQPTCEFLLARTINIEFRDILQSRLSSLTRPDPWLDDLPAAFPGAGHKFPTIYGDKLENIRSAINFLDGVKLEALKFSTQETMTSFWQAAELLFKTGLLTDCLALLTRVADPSDENHFTIWSVNQDATRRQLNRHLRRLVPMFSLLVAPAEPHRRSLDLIRTYFPGYSIDAGSLMYLDLYTILIADSLQKRQYTHYEITQLAQGLGALRPNDAVVDFLLGDSPQNHLVTLQNEIDRRIDSLPHESLVIMEILVWKARENEIEIGREAALNLGRLFEQLHAWIPAPHFAVGRMINQLGKGSSVHNMKREGERPASGPTMAQFGWGRGRIDQENADLQHDELLNNFLGVL